MIDALFGKPKAVTLNGLTFYLTRPTMGDLVAAQHQQAKGDEYAFRRWLLWNHLRNSDMSRVLEAPEDADRLEASAALEALRVIDDLWGEGRD